MKEISEDLGTLTEGYTGAEIALICREAILTSLEEEDTTSNSIWRNLKTSLTKIKKRLSAEHIQKFRCFSLE